jgi:hypothetical protein
MIPVVNPDGYIYSREIDRMWRNSRSGLFKCGADLNRNFQVEFLLKKVAANFRTTGQKRELRMRYARKYYKLPIYL